MSDDDSNLPSEPFNEPANDNECVLDHTLGRLVLDGDANGDMAGCEWVPSGVWECEHARVGLVNGDINSGVTGHDCVPEWR